MFGSVTVEYTIFVDAAFVSNTISIRAPLINRLTKELEFGLVENFLFGLGGLTNDLI